MPRHLLRAVFVLATFIGPAASVAAAPAAPAAWDTTLPLHFQDEGADQPLSEDQLSGFTMPGLTPDNLTDTVLADIDTFWAGEFAANNTDYYAAGIVPVSDTVSSACGDFGPYDNPAAYCPLDDSVYVSLPLGEEIRTSVGDFAWITVLAHEWGHHVQQLLGISPELSIDRELQADCFAGAYARRALAQGYLQEGDVTEAMVITILSADPIEMDETADGAHGSSDYRVTSFMEGYFNGSPACLKH
ncbi:MAG: neutral zinc metallopeptidase [Thermomicrobiales bacterium]